VEPVSRSVTITKRTADRIAGTYEVIETPGAAARVATFEVALVPAATTAVCCIR